jgi:tricarballylate dehydrogenase
MTRRVFSAGGDVWVGSDVTDLERDADVFALSVRRPDGAATVRARDARARHGRPAGGPGGAALAGRRRKRNAGAPWQRLLARRRRAHRGRARRAPDLENKGFYGHLFAGGVAPIAPLDFITFALYHSEEGVADEARSDHNNTMAVAEQGGHALLLCRRTFRTAPGDGRSSEGAPMDRWGFSRDRGGRVTSGSTAAELVPTFREWGYEVALEAFGDATIRGRLGEGSVFAAEVGSAVTMTFGGVEIDALGNVLDSKGKGIPGLYAAGSDASDIYHRGYAGGLCAATVTGRRAGARAAATSLR